MSDFIRNLLNSCVAALSLSKPLNAAATLTGSYKDCGNVDGPVQAVVLTGTSTGSPTAISAAFTLMEADDSSGTNAQAVPQQISQTLTADGSVSILSGQTTKPYVAVKCVLGFTGGVSPTNSVFGVVIGGKKVL